MKTSIYVAGPITGYPNDNREEFEKAVKYLNSIGYEAISPIDNQPRPVNGDPPMWANYMRMGITQLMVCDEIYMLRGWESSKGASEEHRLAHVLGMNKHYQTEEQAE